MIDPGAMRFLILASAVALCACSTVQSRRDKEPVFQQTTDKSVAAFQGCFAERTANLNGVQFLPRAKGGSFSNRGGPQAYVFWVVDIDDLGSERHVTLYAVNSGIARHDALPAVMACL